MNEASTVTFAVLRGFLSCFTTFGPLTEEAAAGAEEEFWAGVPEREGSVEPATCRSLPCVSTNAVGKALNFASSAGGKRLLARAKILLAVGEDSDDKDHSYWTQINQI